MPGTPEVTIRTIRCPNWNMSIEICSKGVTLTDLIQSVMDRLTICTSLASEQKTALNLCDQQIERD